MSTEPKTEPNVTQVVPFFHVSSIEESIRYYVEGLGFEVTARWVDEGKLRWCWMRLGGAALMLQQFRREGPNARTPDGKVGVGVSIYFQCRDALAIYRAARRRGVLASRPTVGNGNWETFLSDPDGYRIAFVSPTDVSEDTVLGEAEGA